jgi:hypothetical protein
MNDRQSRQSQQATDQGGWSVRHLNQEQLARRWGLSPRTLERWRWLGSGPPFLRLNGRVAYRLEDVLAFERESLRKQTPNTPRGRRRIGGIGQ